MTEKRPGLGCGSVVEHLPGMHETLKKGRWERGTAHSLIGCTLIIRKFVF